MKLESTDCYDVTWSQVKPGFLVIDHVYNSLMIVISIRTLEIVLSTYECKALFFDHHKSEIIKFQRNFTEHVTVFNY